MTRSHTILTALATAVCAAAAAQTALAGGEPKNVFPFTRPITSVRASAGPALSASALRRAETEFQGEPKNEAPFTNPVKGSDAVARFLRNSRSTTARHSGKPRNGSPFTTDTGGGNSATARAFGAGNGTS
jgi:hypothetical protein